MAATSDQIITVDYEKAIQNLTDILIDQEKFMEYTSNVYDAIDEDNAGTLDVGMVERFVRNFLRGNQIEGQMNTSFEEENVAVFKSLQDNEAGEISMDELGKFLFDLLKSQVKQLQMRLEAQKYQRSVETMKEMEKVA